MDIKPVFLNVLVHRYYEQWESEEFNIVGTLGEHTTREEAETAARKLQKEDLEEMWRTSEVKHIPFESYFKEHRSYWFEISIVEAVRINDRLFYASESVVQVSDEGSIPI